MDEANKIMGELLQMATFPPEWVVAGWDQKRRILEHFKRGLSITQKEATMQYSVGRLADVVYKLKKDGYVLADEWLTVSNQFGQKCRVKSYYFPQTKK